MRTLWCLRKACGIGYASVGGDVPTTCPGCGADALWSTLAPIHASMPPRVPWELSVNDLRLLSRFHIASD